MAPPAHAPPLFSPAHRARVRCRRWSRAARAPAPPTPWPWTPAARARRACCRAGEASVLTRVTAAHRVRRRRAARRGTQGLPHQPHTPHHARAGRCAQSAARGRSRTARRCSACPCAWPRRTPCSSACRWPSAQGGGGGGVGGGRVAADGRACQVASEPGARGQRTRTTPQQQAPCLPPAHHAGVVARQECLLHVRLQHLRMGEEGQVRARASGVCASAVAAETTRHASPCPPAAAQRPATHGPATHAPAQHAHTPARRSPCAPSTRQSSARCLRATRGPGARATAARRHAVCV
jgi:hypothetical protein